MSFVQQFKGFVPLRCSPLGHFSEHALEQVLRSFDTRVRPTTRSYEIYLDTRCKPFIGEVETVMDYSTEEEELKIIAVPYKPGGHCATVPTDFVPIIEALESLHGLGYVHGDIRAFNTVFGEQGGLIDFDLGGKAGIKVYPQGYENTLPDGIRISGRAGNDNVKTLQFHHDWHALGQLMFTGAAGECCCRRICKKFGILQLLDEHRTQSNSSRYQRIER